MPAAWCRAESATESTAFADLRAAPSACLCWCRYPEGKCFIRLKISTEAIKTLRKKGLAAMAKQAGIDLNKARRCRAPRSTWESTAEDGAPKEMTVAVE